MLNHPEKRWAILDVVFYCTYKHLKAFHILLEVKRAKIGRGPENIEHWNRKFAEVAMVLKWTAAISGTEPKVEDKRNSSARSYFYHKTLLWSRAHTFIYSVYYTQWRLSRGQL